MAEVVAVDTKNASSSERSLLHFDYLVVATGAISSYFNHPEWARCAPGLKTIEDASRIRAQILSCFERAERVEDEDLRRGA